VGGSGVTGVWTQDLKLARQTIPLEPHFQPFFALIIFQVVLSFSLGIICMILVPTDYLQPSSWYDRGALLAYWLEWTVNNFFLCWLQTVILLISTSQVAGIIGVSHHTQPGFKSLIGFCFVFFLLLLLVLF
jgi:hypothetical protein